MTIFLTVIGLLVLIALGTIIGISFSFAYFVTHPSCDTLDANREKLIRLDESLWDFYLNVPKEDWNISSYDGYLLHGNLLTQKTPSTSYVIITHGYTSTRYSCIRYARIFYQMGYNVYMYDLRGHGANAASPCYMGLKEHRDILSITDALYERFGKSITIGLHGESLGCASTLLALGQRQDYQFAVADCGFSNLLQLMRYQSKYRFHMPAFLANTASLASILQNGFAFANVRPMDAMAGNRVPILFITGEADDFIPVSMTKDLYQADSCSTKELHLFPGAVHAKSYASDPKGYAHYLQAFLQEVLS